MAQVYVSIGSNQERNRYIRASLDALHDLFGELTLSSVYESEAVGFEGDNFYNLVAGFETSLSVGELSKTLKNIEDENGRCRQDPRFSGRTLDIDILTYDQCVGVVDGIQLPRDEVYSSAFVLLPMAELIPDECNPENSQRYSTMWQAYAEPQTLWKVDFEWNGQRISTAER